MRGPNGKREKLKVQIKNRRDSSSLGVLLVLLGLVGLWFGYQVWETSTALNPEVKAVLGTETPAQPLAFEIAEWEKFVSQHGDFRDAYLSLAKLYAQEGDKEQATGYFQQAFALDPNSVEVEKLRIWLEEKFLGE